MARRLSDDQVIALVGNWRPLKPPPLLEFVRHCLIVQKESGALIPFEPWPAQEEALKVIEAAEKLVVPKGRQVGITWLELAAMLWAGTFSGNRLFPIARQSDEYAREAISRLLILAGYDPTCEPGNLRLLAESPLPKAWRPRIAGKTRRELRLANGSSYRALTATQPIARGLAAYWGLADEYAFWPWPARQLAAMESGCARLHIVSTGNGADDAFAALYENAAAGRGAYQTLFIPSDADPRRDEEVVSHKRRGGSRSGKCPPRARPQPRRCLPLTGGCLLQALRARASRRGARDRSQLADLAGDRLRLPPSRLSVGAALTGRTAVHRR